MLEFKHISLIIKMMIVMIIFFIIMLVVYVNLPVHLKYYLKIQQGNQLIANIKKHYQQHHKLPENQDYVLLEKLQFPNKHNYTQPEYQKINDKAFRLTYISGFDCLYLTWLSQNPTWRMDCLSP